MNRSVWDDDKCHKVWEHLVTDVTYDWPWKASVQKRFSEIAGADESEVEIYSGSDLVSAKKLRSVVREILLGDDQGRAVEIAEWVVANWGGIGAGKDVIPSWIKELRPFDGVSIANFVGTHQTVRISSWSKILSFANCERHAVYDSRTAVALNAALVCADMRPRFHMPLSRKDTRKEWTAVIKNRSDTLSAGYYEYVFLLERFVDLGLADSILDAERRIFAGSNQTAELMMKKLVSL